MQMHMRNCGKLRWYVFNGPSRWIQVIQIRKGYDLKDIGFVIKNEIFKKKHFITKTFASKIIQKYVITVWPVFWNDEELPKRYVNDPNDVFLCDGLPCEGVATYYKNLPNHVASRFPIAGTKNLLSSSKPNMLYVFDPTVAYYLHETSSNSTESFTNWIDTGHFGEYLGDEVFAKIFKRIFPPGLHKLNGHMQTLLFTRSGKT